MLKLARFCNWMLFVFMLPVFGLTLSHAKDGYILPNDTVATNLQPRGKGYFKKYGFKIFEAHLWTTEKNSKLQPPYALQLKYSRNIKSKRIVQASISEMKKQNVPQVRLERWQNELKNIIPDVEKGDVITGIDNGKLSTFYLNGKLIGQVQDVHFGSDFFGIWLHTSTSDPKLRKQLLSLD